MPAAASGGHGTFSRRIDVRLAKGGDLGKEAPRLPGATRRDCLSHDGLDNICVVLDPSAGPTREAVVGRCVD